MLLKATRAIMNARSLALSPDENHGKDDKRPTDIGLSPLPATGDDMAAWMDEMRAMLLKYLVDSRDQSHCTKKREKIEALTKNMDNDWAGWEKFTDIQSGDFYDDTKRDSMAKAMKKHYKSLAEFHQNSDYYIAQEMWEDFHYYQIPWNRRGQYLGDQDKQAWTGRKLLKANTNLELAQTLRETVFADKTLQWRLYIIALFNIHRIGERADVDKAIDANNLHRYPQTVLEGSEYEERRQHLLKNFPPDTIAEHCRADQDPEEMEIDSREPSEGTGYYSAATPSIWHRDNKQPVHTSWESEKWGPAIGPMRRRCTQATQQTKPRYLVRSVPTMVRSFIYKCKNRSAIRSRGRGIAGYYTERMVYQNHFVLDDQDARIVDITAPMQLTHEFSTPGSIHSIVYELSAERSTIQGPGRMERALKRDKDGFGDYSSSGNFGLGDEIDKGTDENDSDDGDLFTLAYRACVCTCHHEEDCSRDECDILKKRDSSSKNCGNSDVKRWNGDNGDNDSEDDDDDDNDDGGLKGSGSNVCEQKEKIINGKKKSKSTKEKEKSAPTEETSASATSTSTPSGRRTRSLASQSGLMRSRSTSRGTSWSASKSPHVQRKIQAASSKSKPPPSQKSIHTPKDHDETFRLHPTNSSLNVVEYTPKFAKLPGFVQRGEIPAPKKGVTRKPIAEYELYPREALIPIRVSKGQKIISTWTRDKTASHVAYPSGRYTCVVETTVNRKKTRTTREWIPVPMLRLFREDTAEYEQRYKSWNGFEEMIEKDPLDVEDIKKYNKAVSQHYGRRDKAKKEMAKTSEPWTNEEFGRLQQLADNVVHKYGMRSIRKSQLLSLDDFRTGFNGPKQPADKGYRTIESIRSQLNRGKFWLNLKAAAKKLDDRIRAGEHISDADWKPRHSGFFKFTPKKTKGRSRNLIKQAAQQHNAGEKRKRGEETEDEDREGEEESSFGDESELDAEGDSGIYVGGDSKLDAEGDFDD